MNEVEELSKVEVASLPPLKTVLLDDLHQSVLKNLHLELGSGPILYLLSPSYKVLAPAADENIIEFIKRKEDLLDYLKERIVQNLAFYSALVDVNSYFIEQNEGLVLARFRERDSEGRRYEIKFYTHSAGELLSHYEDKIYIGRDFLDLYSQNRKYFGVKESIQSVKVQYGRLMERVDSRLKRSHEYRSFLQEIKESVNELEAESLALLQSLPTFLDFGKLCGGDLITINAQYRTINHYLIELHDVVEEFETHLRTAGQADFVRYVTKFKKDIRNLISYFNIKIIGALTQRIYQSKLRHS